MPVMKNKFREGCVDRIDMVDVLDIIEALRTFSMNESLCYFVGCKQ